MARLTNSKLICCGRYFKPSRHGSVRHGFATLIVLVVVLGLSLAVYSFANRSYLSYAAARAEFRQSQAHLMATSGIEWTISQLAGNLVQRDRMVLAPDSGAMTTTINVEGFRPCVYQQLDGITAIPGLISESAKLNLHALDLTKAGEELSRNRLMALPNVTAIMADSLLDWLDADNIPRDFGAESSWYAENASAAMPSNGPMKNLAELIRVRGFSETILFGEDSNGNGWLDWNEDDGALQLPLDNADGILNEGLAKYLTVHAFESNLDSRGKAKIFLNDDDLVRMYSLLESEYGTQVANFVAAYRLDGPVVEHKAVTADELKKTLDETFEARIELQLKDSDKPLSNNVKIQRRATAKGGVALDRSPTQKIQSIVDLVNVSVITIIDGEEKLLESPWKLTGSDGHRLLQQLDERMTTVEGDRIYGRIDLRQATAEVLQTIPGFTYAMATAVLQLRAQSSTSITNASNWSIYWLVENRICDMEMLRMVAPHITTDGAIYSGYSAGHDLIAHSLAIVKFTLCREGKSVRLLDQSDLGFFPQLRRESNDEGARFPQ